MRNAPRALKPRTRLRRVDEPTSGLNRRLYRKMGRIQQVGAIRLAERRFGAFGVAAVPFGDLGLEVLKADLLAPRAELVQPALGARRGGQR